MKFRGLRPPTDERDVPRFVITELVGVVNDIIHGLKKLTFQDNFESFETTVDVAAGSDVLITNQLNFIPSRYIVVGNSAGQPIGDFNKDEWSYNAVSLKNYGSSDTTITVIFMR